MATRSRAGSKSENLRPKRLAILGRQATRRVISRAVVLAWQAPRASLWRPPGGTEDNELPAGTWVVEAIDKPGERWAVADDLFRLKYRQLRRDQYLNVETVTWRTVLPRHTSAQGDVLTVHTREGEVCVASDDVILKGKAGDEWPVKATRLRCFNIDGRGIRYYDDSALRRLAFLFAKHRRTHVLRRLTGALALCLLGGSLVWAATSGWSRWAPDGHATFMQVCVALLPLGLAVAWRRTMPRRARLNLVALLAMQCLWLVFLTARAAWALRHTGLESVQRGLELFTGGLDSATFALPGSLYRSLASMASIAAAFVGIGTLAAAARALLRDSWDSVVARLRAYDVVVYGLSPAGVQAAADLHLGPPMHGRRLRVVAVDGGDGRASVTAVRAMGVPVVKPTVDAAEAIARAAKHPLRKGWSASYVLLTTPSGDHDSILAAQVKSLAGRTRASSSLPGRAVSGLKIITIGGPAMAGTAILASFSEAPSHVEVIALDTPTTIADLLIREIAPHSKLGIYSVTIIGVSDLAFAIIKALQRDTKLKEAIRTSGRNQFAPLQVEVRWFNAGLTVSELNSRIGNAQDIVGDTVTLNAALTVTLCSSSSPAPDDVLAASGVFGAVVICGSVAAQPVALFEQLRQRYGDDVPIYFEETAVSSAESMSWASLRPSAREGAGLLRTGQLPARVSEHMLGDQGYLGSAVHQYFRSRPGRNPGDPVDQDWYSYLLNPAARDETLQFIERFMVRLTKAGYEVSRSAAGPPQIADWEALADSFGQLEHEAWVEGRIKRDKAVGEGSRHPMAVPWCKLSPEQQALNTDIFRALPDILGACRLVLTQKLTD